MKRAKSLHTHEADLVRPYGEDLPAVIDMEAIRAARVKIGVDPLGGAALRTGKNRRALRPRSDDCQR